MKKIIALVLALCMVLSACVALADETEGLKDARSYINLMYKKKPASTPKDYELIGSVPGDSETYTVEWTADSDTIAITRLESGMVKIDVDENNPKELNYKLTATIKDAAGNETSISFERFVPAAINLDIMTEEEIVETAYGLEDGAALPTATVLTGTIVAIPSAYSDQYDNITVNIQVGDLADKPIQCYRLNGGSSLKVGDEITVLGAIKNYKGTIEFDKGCYTIEPENAQSARVVLFAYSLEDGAALSHSSTVTGVISAIPSAYSADYKNITVNIDVPGLAGGDYTVQCYRLNGGEDLAVGDEITVTGTIKNYKGTIEFDKGCTYVKGAPEAAEEETALAEPEALLSSEGGDDFESLLNGLLGLLGTEESGEVEGSLSGLLGSFADESGEGAGLMDSLSGLFGGDITRSSDDSGFLTQLLQLFTDESGEGGDFLTRLHKFLSNYAAEAGADEGFMTRLDNLFSELSNNGTRSMEVKDMTDKDWEMVFNGILNLFSQE